MRIQSPRPAQQPSNAWLGLAIFLGSYALVFASMTTVYMYFRLREPVWPPAGIVRPDPVLPGMNALVLVAAALCSSWALYSIKRHRWAGLRLGMTFTVLLGLAFSAIQAVELRDLGFSIHDGTYGATFYTLTIFHALHVVVGALWAGVVLARASRGYVLPERPVAIQTTVLYWYFITVAWVLMFAVLYIW